MTTRVRKGKAKTTYRIVCPNFGTRGHSTHHHTKRTLEKAVERAEGNDSLYERMAAAGEEDMSPYYRNEIGWKVQVQTVTEWEDIDV